jgi:dolichol-phosphate mannosyltransferase
LDLAPFAECSEHQHRHDRRTAGRRNGSDEDADTECEAAVTAALEVDEGVADQASCEATDEHGDERQGASTGRGESGQRALGRRGGCAGSIVTHQVIVEPGVASRSVQVTVVVPTYEEVDNIETLLRAVRAVGPTFHVLVVDDASPDGTADTARRVGDEIGGVEVLERRMKDGLGGAYRDGFAHALANGAEVCVQMDADLSHAPENLPALVAAVVHGADAAIGSRYVPGGHIVDWPRLRRWLSRWGNRYAAAMLGLAVNDATSGYRAYTAEALERMDFSTVRADGYGFQVEMTHRLVRADGRIVEIPITFVDRRVGESKLSHHIIGEAFRLVLRLAWHDLGDRRRRRRAG